MKAGIYTTIGSITITAGIAASIVTPQEQIYLWGNTAVATYALAVAIAIAVAIKSNFSKLELAIICLAALVATAYFRDSAKGALQSYAGTRQTLPERIVVTPQADINASCSTNGFGHVTCSFRNTGSAAGNKCVKIQLKNYLSAENNYDGSRGITSEEFCSGIVQPSDVKDRSAPTAFYDTQGRSTVPHKYCEEGNSMGNWPYRCKFEVVPTRE